MRRRLTSNSNSSKSSFSKTIRSLPGRIFRSSRTSEKKNHKEQPQQNEPNCSTLQLPLHLANSQSFRKRALKIGGKSETLLETCDDTFTGPDTETVLSENSQLNSDDCSDSLHSKNSDLTIDDCSISIQSILTDTTATRSVIDTNANAAKALFKFKNGNYQEAVKLYSSVVLALHQEEERRDLVIAAVYCGKADTHVALYDWLPAIGLYKSALKIRMEKLNQTDRRIVDVLQKLSNAMEQNDVLGREAFDSDRFNAADRQDMIDVCDDLRQEMKNLDDFEEELIFDTDGLTGGIPMDARTVSLNSDIDRIFGAFNEKMNEF
mmetsp:Transcript_40425/g.47300  ORF Transcript_40425/g.47300 Transcript_40425/m.47300 type:complete len:321 (-) Transcript_40425:128-1090(-)|eukprot:CAMPEP_0194383166 /NCGR_PEP_ID=MMETSP0174-20130528/65650_1 /TAXON_ID=216777 /ORGANISM="Proboscia alata, Strain PI-D3" /LENGTH=320 /DNA_ID=CAMNT_0039169173 /DNA_START=81 /DNA_END=1043 /DNA_ORIENTATION=-